MLVDLLQLNKVLQVKKNKERSLMGKIAQIDSRRKELTALQEELKTNLFRFREDMRNKCNQRNVLDYSKLMIFKSTMADLYQRDLQMSEESIQLQQRQKELEIEREELHSDLKSNRKGQEKLKFLIQDEMSAN